jgi:hypothetical protein
MLQKDETLISIINSHIKSLCTNCGEVNCPVAIDSQGKLPHCYKSRTKLDRLFEPVISEIDPPPGSDRESEVCDCFDNIQTR